jgi:hypothetical protein
MSVRTSRRLLFAAIFLLAPAPLLVLTRGWMPPATYLLLAGVSLSFALTEGAGGPVPLIVSMFAVHAVLYAVLAWGLAWLMALPLARLTPGARRGVTLGLVAIALVIALGWDVYRTPFGRRPFGNAIEALS